MRRSEGRVLTTHTGSLPRPPELTRLYARRSRGETVSPGELEAAGQAALHWVVGKQAEAGIDIANNGEQQRDSFVLYVRDRLSGLGGTWQRRQRADVERYPIFKRQTFDAATVKESVDDISGLTKALGEVRYLDAAPVAKECADFLAALDQNRADFAETFLTAPSPGMVSAIVRNEHYPSEEAYLAALAEALRVEYETIVSNGFLLQLDCPDLARERHNTYQDRPIDEFLAFGCRVVDAINHALRNIARERVRMHVCWGNYEGPHDCDVPLKEIVPVLRRAKVGGFVLPFANPRHAHEFRCVKDLVGADQVIVAGVIDTTTNYVEHPEVVADRLERVARILGDPSRVLAGTDCGFETIAGKGRVAQDIAWAKLAALSEGAELATRRLF
ncbi:MAG: epoxyalkane--coenzyme M transferase [Hyphomicrobiaceae bacterium]|nr:epoxyalkane--coenzyme M transferase [Hyphomicrobiaceae bacterium]